MSENDPVTIWAPDTIVQTTFERLCDLIRAGAIGYLAANPNAPWLSIPWRDKPWMDGVVVDMDEDDVVRFIARHVIEHADPARIEGQ